MALVNRLSRLFKADFHAVLDSIEEPELLLKQAIRDMEDDLVATEQRIIYCEHDQDALSVRKRELEDAISEFHAELDICFDSNKDDLAKTLIKKKLEVERMLKRLTGEFNENGRYVDEQRSMLDSNRTTLENLRQKAALFSQRMPKVSEGRSQFDDISWMAREMSVGDDEIEIAYLREKALRVQS